MTQIFESKIRSRLGIFRLKIHDTTDTITDQQEAPVRGALKLRVADPQRGYGPPVMGSYAQVDFQDPGGFLRDVFSGIYTETDYPVHIDGPDIAWRGCVRQGLRSRTMAPRVSPGRTRLYLYDRIGALRGIDGTPNRQISDILFQAFAAANPHVDLVVYFGAEASNQHTPSPENLRYQNANDRERRGDVGSFREQVEEICTNFGARAYFDVREGAFFVRHRPSIGEALSSAYQLDLDGPSSAWTTVSVEADTVQVTRGEIQISDDDLEELRPATSIKMGGPVEPIVRDGEFEHLDGFDIPILWNTTAGRGTGDGFVEFSETDGSGDPIVGLASQTIGRVNGGAGMFFELSYEAIGLGGAEQWEQRISLVGDSGTTWYLTTSGSWSQTEQGDGATGQVTRTSEDFFPESGLLRIVGEGHNMKWGNIMGRFIDREGEEVDDWTITIPGSAVEGSLVEIDRPRAIEVDNDGSLSWMPASSWSGDRLADTYERLETYVAADRLAQQAEGLETLQVTHIAGLHGPGTRLMVRKPGASEDSAFICVGRVLDITAGQTELVDVELPAEVLS